MAIMGDCILTLVSFLGGVVLINFGGVMSNDVDEGEGGFLLARSVKNIVEEAIMAATIVATAPIVATKIVTEASLFSEVVCYSSLIVDDFLQLFLLLSCEIFLDWHGGRCLFI